MKDRLVNFIICGTQKGGTSALYEYLIKHPQICMSDIKEPHFFDNEDFFTENNPDYAQYHSFFNPQKQHKIIGEATPVYMYWYSAPKRMWQYNPNMKLIVLLRNPIERAFSHWNMERERNADNLSFWIAIQNEQIRCRSALPYQHRVYSYIDRGFYVQQLRRLWLYFPPHQTLILKNDDLKNEPIYTLNQICEFLEVDKFTTIEPRKSNIIPYKSTISEQEKNYLKFIFEYEIKNLARILKWDCNNWLSS